MVLDIQINPTSLDWPQLLDQVLQAEDEGFDAAWVYDHLAGRSLGGTRMLECFSLLGALASSTSRISLGTMVVNMTLREPAVVVAAAASVQLISGRPFLLGLGAGAGPSSPWAVELHASEVEPPTKMVDRHARVEQTLELCQRMWSSDRHPELATFALPSPPPLRLVGVNSVALAELAGRRADGINVPWRHPQRPQLLAAAEAARRPGTPFVRTVWVADTDGLADPDHPTHREIDEAGIDRLIVVRTPTGS